MQTLIKRSIQYFLWFLLLYGILVGVGLTPGGSAFFSRLYRAPTESVLNKILPKARFQIKADGAINETLRIEYVSSAQLQEQIATVQKMGKTTATIDARFTLANFHNLFLSFFLFYVVLVLLSPVSWKDKFTSLLIGSVLYFAYTIFKLYLFLLIHLNQPEIAIYQTGPGVLKIISGIYYFMTLGTSVLIVLFIWAALVLKKNNWMSVLDGSRK